jgi:hypothetical protein
MQVNAFAVSPDETPFPRSPLDVLDGLDAVTPGHSFLVRQASGNFYTPREIADHLISVILRVMAISDAPVRVCDPFAGDGRLVVD